MNKKAKVGIALLIVGVIGLAKVYSLRPISLDGDHEVSQGEAMYMATVLGRETWIREPQYQIYLSIFGVISIVGLAQLVIAMRTNKDACALNQDQQTKENGNSDLASSTKCAAVSQPTTQVDSKTEAQSNSLNSKLHLTLIITSCLSVLLLYTTKLIGLIELGNGISLGLCVNLYFRHQQNNFIYTSKIDWMLLLIASSVALSLTIIAAYDIQAILLVFVFVRSLMIYFTINSKINMISN